MNISFNPLDIINVENLLCPPPPPHTHTPSLLPSLPPEDTRWRRFMHCLLRRNMLGFIPEKKKNFKNTHSKLFILQLEPKPQKVISHA